jgi:hypothetical protein
MAVPSPPCSAATVRRGRAGSSRMVRTGGLLVLLAVLVGSGGLPATDGLAFHPKDPADNLWDTWIYRKPDKSWLLNYLVKHHTPKWEAWNAISSASSPDGAHFTDHGVSIQRHCDCCNSTCASDANAQLGSSSVWRHLDQAGGEHEWLMAYGSTPAAPPGASNCNPNAPGCHGMYFSKSTDLENWQPIGKMGDPSTPVFRPNASLYVSHYGDCIAALPRQGGGYYGYFSTLPMPRADLCGELPTNCTACFAGRPGNTSQCHMMTGDRFGGRSCNICGAGLAESDDGLHWEALPTPGPAVGPSLRAEPWGSHSAEVGGVCQLGGRVFMTFDAGHLYEAPSARGPFRASQANFNFLTGETGAVFPRLWGELYTGDKDLVLVTHQQLAGNNYAGLVKRAVLGEDGVLRAQWWDANDALQGTPLHITRNDTGSANMKTDCTGSCMQSGIWLEGSMVASNASSQGVWLACGKDGGYGFNIDQAGRFLLFPGHALVVDRAMPAKSVRRFRLLARTSSNGEGLAEFYVDDVVGLPVSLRACPWTGVFAGSAGVEVTSAFKLSLPQS